MSMEYVRVTDGKSGNAWTTVREIADADGLTVLTNPDGELVEALDPFGTPLPPSRVPAVEPAEGEVAAEPPAEQVIEPAEPAKPKTTRIPAAEPAVKEK